MRALRHRLLRVAGVGILLLAVNDARALDRMQIDYPTSAPDGLVGNGASIVKVRADGFAFHEGGSATGQLRLFVDGVAQDLTARGATFFPGGVAYRLHAHSLEVEVIHGASAATPYILAVHVEHASGTVELQLDGEGEPAITPRGRTPIPLSHGAGTLIAYAGVLKPALTWQGLRAALEAPYQAGFVLETPNARIDRAVPFNRFLLDLAFNGRLHVCELFRWRDVWSRDLGSGLAPGAMVDGAFAAARTTIEYDLRRYAAAPPLGLKVTDDPSQGGGAEGVAWLTRAVWREYLLSGDEAFLRRAAATLRPWVDTWIDRDADERGLLIDVTEWMDHSRFLLFPDGARVLYSNVLFAALLQRFALIERTLGDDVAAARLETVHQRFVRGINAGLWDEQRGEYDNLTLWGERDQRSSSDGNILAILAGVVPEPRIGRVLDTVRELNWQRAGSVTITPPMTHVDAHNDHNFKVWPWWNAVEARARLQHGDIAGGVHLLEGFAATLEDPALPGLVEELTTPDGVGEGGQAFATAAGAYQDAIFEGLLGIQVLEAGRARLRIAPNTPAEWTDWRATVPLPGGELQLVQAPGHLRIRVTDPAVKVIEAPPAASVSGARRAPLTAAARLETVDLPAPTPLLPPAPRSRRAAVFEEPGLPASAWPRPHRARSAEQILTLDPAVDGALIVPGNALPRWSASGADVPEALGRYLDKGGAIVFFGATMHDRQIMGEQGGVVDWYAWRPRVGYTPVRGWRFRASPDTDAVGHAAEHGLTHGWQLPALDDSGWMSVELGKVWADHPATQFSGWEWLRARVHLDASARGRPVVLTLGRINDHDWTYLNGTLIGTGTNAKHFRSYWLRPGDAAYEALHFGGENLIAVQVLYAGRGGGPYSDPPTLGVQGDEPAWMALDAGSRDTRERPERFGVVSWGPGNFFNSWETARGAFGFSIEGRGVQFAGPLAGLAPLEVPTAEAFTDFAVRKPWLFEPLGWTHTQRRLLYPDHGERYPAAARLVNQRTGGEIILIPASIAQSAAAPLVLKQLGLEVSDGP